MARPPQRSDPFGAFLASQALWREAAQGGEHAELSLQDINEIQLLLRGQSVIDWHRLAVTSDEDVVRLLALNGLELSDPRDEARLADLRQQAVRYISDVLKLRLDDTIADKVPWVQLPRIASGKAGAHQRQACTVLKVMHILYHLEAREMRASLAISDSEIFSLVEESVTRMFDELRTAGVPVVEFSWSRKSKESQLTKLLLKRETNAARVFDRLRFRLIVRDPDDLVPTLRIMLHRCIPFNYVVPDQTVNTLIDLHSLKVLGDTTFDTDAANHPQPGNEFSGKGFHVLNFVADLPVRVDALLPHDHDERRGRVVFVLAEFQVMDKRTAEANEQGESSHAEYKRRQHQHVRMRLLREPRDG
ncbi:TIGR04552 family protein [Nannocystis bainbridge]|uniref:TIGR04552 family protein n=1 Tax=Nannocystis bainbridge TaxID=2995303 RepID=A0ABT5DVR0_9BACT|nr:TIGR04552 family protein [Nannocystis bainbridge]MDC0717694.1 TIGR04552 family protein [Nannocystis bainbridge]